jgi:hypothetical protein
MDDGATPSDTKGRGNKSAVRYAMKTAQRFAALGIA